MVAWALLLPFLGCLHFAKCYAAEGRDGTGSQPEVTVIPSTYMVEFTDGYVRPGWSRVLRKLFI